MQKTKKCVALGLSFVLWLASGAAQETQPADGGGVVATKSTQSPAETDGGSEYRVGPGDVLVVSVWKEPEVSSIVMVRPDGKISLPLINDLSVGDMTPTGIMQLVVERLTPLISNPLVTVTVKEIHSKVVYVIGEVGRAGQYEVIQPTTVLQILTQAGGLTPFAKAKSIYVLRAANGKQEKLPFNYKDVVSGKNMQQNILLKAGDTVIVP